MIRKTALALALAAGVAGAPAWAADPTAASLFGSYTVEGTATDGSPYEPGTLTIAAEPSGAIGVTWDGGDYVGIGALVGNTLAVASVADGKNSIILMSVGADGNLSGKWWRRTDPGTKGTEIWKKKK